MRCIYINEQRVRQSSISYQRQTARWGIGTHLRQHLGTCSTSIMASTGLQKILNTMEKKELVHWHQDSYLYNKAKY